MKKKKKTCKAFASLKIALSKNERGILPIIAVFAAVAFILLLLSVGFIVSGILMKPTSSIAEETTPTSGNNGTVSELDVNGVKIKIASAKGKLGVESATEGLAFSCSPEEKKWYVNMRWPSQKWAWNGRNKTAENTLGLYAHKKVIIINPRTKKAVVTAICESGPAPWTGSSWYKQTKDRSVGPDFWEKGTSNEWHQFDPPEADGRVAGAAPEPFKAIESKEDEICEYGFASDQNVPLGPIQLPSAQ